MCPFLFPGQAKLFSPSHHRLTPLPHPLPAHIDSFLVFLFLFLSLLSPPSLRERRVPPASQMRQTTRGREKKKICPMLCPLPYTFIHLSRHIMPYECSVHSLSCLSAVAFDPSPTRCLKSPDCSNIVEQNLGRTRKNDTTTK